MVRLIRLNIHRSRTNDSFHYEDTKIFSSLSSCFIQDFRALLFWLGGLQQRAPQQQIVQDKGGVFKKNVVLNQRASYQHQISIPLSPALVTLVLPLDFCLLTSSVKLLGNWPVTWRKCVPVCSAGAWYVRFQRDQGGRQPRVRHWVRVASVTSHTWAQFMVGSHLSTICAAYSFH